MISYMADSYGTGDYKTYSCRSGNNDGVDMYECTEVDSTRNSPTTGKSSIVLLAIITVAFIKAPSRARACSIAGMPDQKIML